MSGTVASPTGITDPPIDDLLEVADSKYALVIYAAKRARQINAYYAQLNEGLLEYVGPLVETAAQEKPLSIAMREINRGLLRVQPIAPEDLAAAKAETAAPLLDDLTGLGDAPKPIDLASLLNLDSGPAAGAGSADEVEA